jgi:hypothetical protein
VAGVVVVVVVALVGETEASLRLYDRQLDLRRSVAPAIPVTANHPEVPVTR